MTDLNDGESVEMKGSAATPYVIRNTGGVYSCSCPAWRNQSIAIEQRTCKHIRKLRGDEAENARVGSALLQKPVKKSASGEKEDGSEPPILLAESWDNFQDLSGWWMSEKLDGVRAYWDGKQFLSRQGNIYHAPEWFLEGLPDVPLDGELWIDRKAFQRTVSIVRRQDKNDQWKQVRYLVFDAPSQSGRFEDRMAYLQDGVSSWKNEYLSLHQQILCRDVQHLRDELRRVEGLGGEGLMLREPGSTYAVGRSSTLLKVKTFHDAEATVIGHEPGRGKHEGRLGALVVQLPNGKQFSVGTGFSDREREHPPAIGSLIQFRYQELSDAGIPRFPGYVGLRSDVEAPQNSPKPQPEAPSTVAATKKTSKLAAARMAKPDSDAERTPPAGSNVESGQPVNIKAQATSANSATIDAGVRRFEFVEGGSSKFWEVRIDGQDVTTRWGRIGSDGQSKTKSFASSDKSQSEYAKLIQEKTEKGYQEVGGAPHNVTVTSGVEVNHDDGRGAEPVLPIDLTAAEAGLTELFENLGAMFDDLPDHLRAEALRELKESLDDELNAESSAGTSTSTSSAGPPESIQLRSVESAPFQTLASMESLTKQIRKAGFGVIGDFTIDGLPICLRAFLRGGDTLAVITELAPIQWVELQVLNADKTVETWSNVPMHDGRTPPWSRFVQQPDADFNQLHTMMVQQRSDKEPGQLEASEFAEYFMKSYERSMAWRASTGSDAAMSHSSPTAAIPAPVPTDTSRSNHKSTPQTQPADIISPPHLELVQKYLKAFRAIPNARMRQLSPKDVEPGKQILAMSANDQSEIVKAILSFGDHDELGSLYEALLKKRLPYSRADITYLCAKLKNSARNGYDKALIGAIERWAESATLPRDATNLLHDAVAEGRAEYWQTEFETLKTRVEKLANSGEGSDERPLRIPISETEVWATTAIRDLGQMEASHQRRWTQLLQCCAEASSSKASDKWIHAVRPIIESITKDEFFAVVSRWLPLVEKPQPEDPAKRRHYFQPLAISEINELILRGLVWCLSLVGHPDSPRLLGQLAKAMYRTVPGQGPRSQKIGNACVFALGQMSHREAISQLAILKIKVRNGTAQRFIEGELNKAAERLRIPREDLEEMSVPTYGLEDVGERREVLGDFTALLTATPQGDTELRWLKPDGTTQKSVPSSLEKDFADDIKDLKSAIRDIQKMVGVQRERIDGLALQRKSWTVTDWRERYLDHPLVGLIARRLIWNFQTDTSVITGGYLNGRIVSLDGQPISNLPDSTKVSLWHPIGHTMDEITRWRQWLEDNAITQPFRQAHREIYVLTDAERQTDVYSNRFAAHVLKQTQLRALAQARGWHAKLLGYWDGGYDAQLYRYLPAWNITAQFWIQGIEPEGNDYGDTAGMPYVTTDQVRFYGGQHKEYAPQDDVLALVRVPELVLSEIMRDVDLFVGVSSIGNDPNWQDGGVRPYEGYWQSYAFGELSESSETRRDVLKRIIPRLKIASRCSFEDKFLVVRGDLRTYRIHFGSGNIMMEPNDQYLCIVPKPVAESSVFLPFEGDRTLSIILSKAMLLAEDRKIRDSTILSQIQNR